MTSFSDALDRHITGDFEQPDGLPGEPVEEFEVAPKPRTPADVSGPDPSMIPGAEVMELFTTVEGKRRVPDNRRPPEEVEQLIRDLKLNPADIRGERLLPNRDAATFLGITEATLKAWRDANINLPYYVSPMVGRFNTRRIYYRLADLIRYREFVLTHFTPDIVQMPTPGMMGTPLT